jgi:hypothetical protein
MICDALKFTFTCHTYDGPVVLIQMVTLNLSPRLLWAVSKNRSSGVTQTAGAGGGAALIAGMTPMIIAATSIVANSLVIMFFTFYLLLSRETHAPWHVYRF